MLIVEKTNWALFGMGANAVNHNLSAVTLQTVQIWVFVNAYACEMIQLLR